MTIPVFLKWVIGMICYIIIVSFIIEFLCPKIHFEDPLGE